MSSTPLGSTVLGYPRIGPDRELKRAVEGYWAGRTSAAELAETAQAIRAQTARARGHRTDRAATYRPCTVCAVGTRSVRGPRHGGRRGYFVPLSEHELDLAVQIGVRS